MTDSDQSEILKSIIFDSKYLIKLKLLKTLKVALNTKYRNITITDEWADSTVYNCAKAIKTQFLQTTIKASSVRHIFMNGKTFRHYLYGYQLISNKLKQYSADVRKAYNDPSFIVSDCEIARIKAIK